MDENNSVTPETIPAMPVEAPVQPTPIETPTQPTPTETPRPQGHILTPKKKPKFLIALGVILVIAAVGGIIFGLTKLIRTAIENYEDENTYKTTGFFIHNKDSQYALFSKNGERLSDFSFMYVSKLTHGTAMVQLSSNEEYGIIDGGGKMTVDFGTYERISKIGALYDVVDSEGKRYLINGNGEILYELNEDSALRANDNITALYHENSVFILGYRGDEILTVDSSESLRINSNYDFDNYTILSSNTKIYIIDSDKPELVSSAAVDIKNEDELSFYRLLYANPEKKLFVIKESRSDIEDAIIIHNDTIANSSDDCAKYHYDPSYEMFYCNKDGEEYILNDNLEIVTSAKNTQYAGGNNYAKGDEETNTANIYKDGSLVASIPCHYVAWSSNTFGSYYVLRTTPTTECRKKGVKSVYAEYFNEDGQRVIDRGFKAASMFKGFEIATVRELGSDNYSLIDKNGTKISDKNYRYIHDYEVGDSIYFCGYDNDGEKISILNNLGNKIATAQNSYDISSSILDGKLYIVINTNDDQYVIYRAEDGEKILTSDSAPLYFDDYIKVEGEKTSYYTFDGKLLFEE